MSKYKCNHCNYSTKYNYHLMRHLKSVHKTTDNDEKNQNINVVMHQKEMEYPLIQQQGILDSQYQHVLQHCYELQQQLENQQHNHALIIECKQRELNECLKQKALEYQNAIILIHKQAQECININRVQYQKALEKQVNDFEASLEEKVHALVCPYSCKTCGLRMQSKIELDFHKKKKHAKKKKKKNKSEYIDSSE